MGVATAFINVVFWSYTQWGRVQRDEYATWRHEHAKDPPLADEIDYQNVTCVFRLPA